MQASCVSLADWQFAVSELNSLDSYDLPCQKMEILLNTAAAIFAMHKHQQNQLQQKESPIGGDDFLPIFTYVMVHSSLAHPVLTNAFLWALADPQILLSQSGYYLTAFSAAVQFIERYTPHA
eukprot:TRINITY_DN14571_c0_g1_i2.p1 TRINITY_DN14571_c0_g1~~TRINITY_DN14571_c0_g1_i2.p1  ORF type:complete len:122 (-),score=15.16 TRINITY_DN14571_c0_g1_i2:32-397(-)